MTAPPALLRVEDLVVHFNAGRRLLPGGSSRTVRAVNGVSLTVHPGETVGLVGESGSGKSTFGRAVLRLLEPSGGSILFDGIDMARGTRGDVAALRRQTAMIFVAHDLAIVRHLCDRIAVMYLGRVVEEGPTEAVFANPRHPYTASLIDAIPDIDPDNPLPTEPLPGEPPSPVDLPPGCPFHPRCRLALDACRAGAPPPPWGEDGHWGACVHAPSVIADPHNSLETRDA
jgi:oligopeptide/dipeptide ABC transporter ATP-binding protein